MNNETYLSSEGIERDPKKMNYEYLVNDLNKSMRTIFDSETLDRCNVHIHNIEILEKEIRERIDNYIVAKYLGGRK